ncbi:unnamed protein product [Prorocentrum cordatum]|uniref:RING-type domain-containing protein n=1 Tax=Prorocentrum cordatum TaxID=2364126 RepID=A0ABN9PS57_9DINO|nr:unnamed protein product [Polarella glacialis]
MSGKVKPCPTCSRLIQKNGGCVHMTCRAPAGCGHEFNWDCLCPWGTHGGRPCTRAPAEEDARKTQISAERLWHYQDQFVRQREAQAWAMRCVDKSKALLDSCIQSSATARNLGFLPCVAGEVVKGRRILKWTHAFAYLMDARSPECDLFNLHQVRLLEILDMLSDLTENTDWEMFFQAESSSSQEDLLQKRSEALSLCYVLQEAFGALDTWMSGLGAKVT